MTRHWTNSGLSSQNSVLPPANVASFFSIDARMTVSEPQRAWTTDIKSRLDELAALPVGWDGYGGRPVSFSVANFALQILNRVCSTEAIQPQIVPGSGGDLQIEWHTPAGELEVYIRAPYEVQAWRCSKDTDEDGETVELTTDFTVLGDWIRKLAEQSRAVDAAAA